MEEGIKEETKAAAAASSGQTTAAAATSKSNSTTVGDMADTTFKSIGDVLKLLPTATVIVVKEIRTAANNNPSDVTPI